MATRSEKVQIVVGAKDKASSTLSKVKNQIIGIGAAYMGWRAVSGILSSITKAGMEHEKVWTEVAGALKRHGHEVDKGIKSIQKFADEMQTLTGISDETIGKGVQLFIDYGASIDEAKDTMKVAADLAAGSGMDMKAAVDLMAKAQVGYTGTLSRYGIILDESIPKNEKFAAAIAQINQKFGGAAADRMDTTAVKVSLLSEKFGDLQEELFKIGAPALLGGVEFLTDTVGGLIGLFSDTSAIDRITDLRTEMESIGTKTQGLVTTYSQLITETNLNVTGQDALRTVTQQLADLVPTAVTAWDDYGNAVGINTEKVNEYVEAQEAALKVEFLRSVSDLRAEFEELIRVQGQSRGVIDYFIELNKTTESAPNAIVNIQEALLSANEALRGNTAGIERMLAVGSTAYPELTAGTTAYKEAVALLGQKFADQIFAFQEQSEQQIATTTETQNTIVALHSDAAQSIIGIHDELHEIYDEDEAYQTEVALKGIQERLRNVLAAKNKELAAFLKAERIKESAARKFAQEAGAMSAQFADSAISMFGKTKREADQIWKDMAKAFMNFFIKKALAMLLPGGPFVSGLLGALRLFDVAANDRMAMQMGKDYIDYFARGAKQAMGQFTGGLVSSLTVPSPMLNATNSPAAGSNIYITVSADVDEGSVRSKIAPILEELANNKFTNIVNDESTITGESAIEFA